MRGHQARGRGLHTGCAQVLPRGESLRLCSQSVRWPRSHLRVPAAVAARGGGRCPSPQVRSGPALPHADRCCALTVILEARFPKSSYLWARAGWSKPSGRLQLLGASGHGLGGCRPGPRPLPEPPQRWEVRTGCRAPACSGLHLLGEVGAHPRRGGLGDKGPCQVPSPVRADGPCDQATTSRALCEDDPAFH